VTLYLVRNIMIVMFCTIVISMTALCLGPINYSPHSMLSVLSDPLESNILLQLRLPRVIFALLVGFALSLAGVGTQGIFRNPLADPYVLGISGGASVGAAAALAFTNTHTFSYMVGFAFLGAFSISLFLIMLTRTARWSTHTILLVGIAINLFCGSLLSVIMFTAHEQTTNIILWLMGNLGHGNWSQIIIVATMVCIGTTALIAQAHHLDVHLFGEETAFALGADINKYRPITILSVCVLVCAAVCFCGAIGFVGLVIPHAVRLVVGTRHLKLMCIAPLVGACFLVICDTLARLVILPQELPVGVITGLLGGPVFIYLLFTGQRS
jgi:iron complex transport system permease protein